MSITRRILEFSVLALRLQASVIDGAAIALTKGSYNSKYIKDCHEENTSWIG